MDKPNGFKDAVHASNRQSLETYNYNDRTLRTLPEIKSATLNEPQAGCTSSENADIPKIRGPKQEVDKSPTDLLQIVEEHEESSFSVEVPIFKQFHKFVIGKGDANIRNIRDETETKIDLPTEDEENEVILITGRKENVQEAREKIQKLQNEFVFIVREEVQLSPKYFNSLIGTEDKLISSIIEECGSVSIRFPPSESMSDKVTICGPQDDVEKAKAQLLELASEHQFKSFTTEVYAKHQHLKFLIEKNRASIQKICDGTGARIIFPKNDDENKEGFTIIGKEEDVKTAKEQLEVIINDFDKVTEAEILIDPKYHKHFVSKQCKVIQRIQEECGSVSISFPRYNDESDRVTLKGTNGCNEAAKQRITEIVSDLEAQVTIDCAIPQWSHRAIMGPGGVKVKGISEKFDVQIKFPDRVDKTEEIEGTVSWNDDIIREIIRITGRKEKAEAAKQALIDLIPITEEINVPFDLHSLIIGRNGRNIREFTGKYEIHIEFSPRVMKHDLIKITGAPVNVAEAKKALLDQVKDIEADRKDRELRSFEIKIYVDPEYHPKLIGYRGAVINKICRDFDVNILIPSRRDIHNLRTIAIQGYEANAKAAREEIGKIVNDRDELVHEEIAKIVNDRDELVHEVIEIDTKCHKRLIGQRGRNVRKIMEDYKVDLKFPKPGDENLNCVTITGSVKALQEAKDCIYKLEQKYKNLRNETEDNVTEQIKIPYIYFSAIIGVGGKVISSIRQECGGVSIRFPPSKAKSDMITISGPKADVEKAKIQLLEIVSESYTVEIYANQQYHKVLIGRSIKKIRMQTRSRFIFPGVNDENKDAITIIGKEENVKAAEEQLQAVITTLTVEEIIINLEDHERLISIRHKIIHLIKKKFLDVSLTFTRFDDGSGSGSVTFAGTKGGIQTAKEIFYGIMEQVTIHCDIPKTYYKAIKNSPGFPLQRLRYQFNVHIEFSGRHASEEIIHITGRKENAECAKQALIDLIPITEEITVPFNLHRSIFGTKKQFRLFMSTYNVHIELPTKKMQLDTSTIKIIGIPSKIAEAKKVIYDKVKKEEDYQELRQLESCEIKLVVDPEYHTEISRSAVIQQLCDEFMVKVSFPKKKYKVDSNIITIKGYEPNAKAIHDEIIKIANDLKERASEVITVSKVIDVDKKMRNQFFGRYGDRIRQQFDINMKFPNPSEGNLNTIIITGSEENVQDAIKHISNLKKESI